MSPERDVEGRSQSPGSPRPADLEGRLEAEQAGTAYWREVARQRRVEAAAVQRRPIVRAAIAVDRRTRARQARLASQTSALATWSGRRRIAASAVRSRTQLGDRRRSLANQLAQVAPSPPVDGRVVVVHLGPPPDHRPTSATDVYALPTDASTAAINAAIEAAWADPAVSAVCLLGPTARTLAPGWLEHLVAAIDPDVAISTPLVLHPERTPWTATPHDLLVRWSGLDVAVSDGGPIAVGRGAGERPDLTGPSQRVTGAAGTALVVARDAWVHASGLAVDLPYEAAVVDLTLRVSAAGGTVVAVPAAAMVDVRPVRSGSDLIGPLAPTGPEWLAVIERHGPRLAHEASGSPNGTRASIALTTATPSKKLAPRSGDWHYAGLLASALRRAGHRVVRQTIEEADSPAGRSCDVHLVLRGLEPVRRTPGQRHILWIISHPETIETGECDEADLILVASERFAAYLRTITNTPVEVMLQATDPSTFHPGAASTEHRHRVTVVANTRGVMRPAIADAFAAGIQPAIYGQGWSGLVDSSAVVADYVAFESLPSVYAAAGVVLNDHWETMRRWGFVSNRIFDVIACGTPVISDDLPEIHDLFGTLVPTWSGPGGLRAAIEALEADPEGTARRTAEARDLVVDRHTFDHRVAQLDDLLVEHALSAPGNRP